MKKTSKYALLAAAALTAAASARAASYNGDLIIGLSSGSGNDTIYDLGSVSSLYNNEQWSIPFTVGTLTQWGVVGNTLNPGGRTTDNQIYSTVAYGFSPPSANSSTYASESAAVGNMYSLFSAAGAGNSISIPTSNQNSWYAQTINPTLSGQYLNAYANPNVIGETFDVLAVVDDQGGPTVALGTFDLASNGTLTYMTVPEPTTYGLLAGFGLLALAFRRKLSLNA